jgi:hypothetical protein
MAFTMTQIPEKRVKSVRITNKKAVALINDRAAREFRSASGTAALVVIEHLGDSDINKNLISEQGQSGGGE